MNRLLALVLAFSTFCPSALPAQNNDDAAAPPAETTIGGSVVNAEGEPVAQATVRLKPERSQDDDSTDPQELVVVNTGEDGGFEATLCVAESYLLRVEAVGFAPFSDDGVEPAGAVDVQLKQGHAVHGRVLDLVKSRPIADATVRACDRFASSFGPEACTEVATDGDGNFTVADLAAEPHSFTFGAEGYDGRTLEEVSVPPRPDRKTGEAEPLLAFLGPGGRIAGKAVDADGEPLAGVRVRLNPLDVARNGIAWKSAKLSDETDEDGSFELPGIPAGVRYLLHARSGDHAPYEAGPFSIEKGTDLSDLTVKMARGASLKLRIVDSDERPVERISATIRDETDEPRTARVFTRGHKIADKQIDKGDEGSFTIKHLDPGRVTLEITPRCCEAIEQTGILLKNGETADLGTLTVKRGRRITGTVTDAAGDPIVDAHIGAYWREERGVRSRSVKTRKDGGYRISGLGEQELDRVTANAKDFAGEVRQAVFPDEEAVDFVLERNGRIEGRVMNSRESPAVEFNVAAFTEAGGGRDPSGSVMPWNPERKKSFRDETGAFSLDDLKPGTYTVVAKARGMAQARKAAVQVVAEQATDVGVLTLERGVTLSGRVVTAKDEQPVPGAGVCVGTPNPLGFDVRRPDKDMTAIAGMDGTFTIDGLEPGAVTITAEHPDYSTGEIRVELSRDTPPDEAIVRLSRGGELTGTVRGRDGQPVVGDRIMLREGILGGDPKMTTTGPDGRYRFERNAPGSYMAARLPQGGSVGGMGMKTVVIEEGKTTVLDFDEQAGIRLSGRVLRGEDPVGDLTLLFLSGDVQAMNPSEVKTASTDPEGSYSVGLDAPGAYQVVVAQGGILGATQTIEIIVPDEADVERDILLQTLGVSGTVTDSNGEPVSGAAVVARLDGSEGFAGQSGTRADSNGRYTIEGLEPGTYRMTAQAPGYALSEQYPVAVSEELPQTVDFELKKGRILRGRVVDPSGKGLAGAMVTYWPSGAAATSVASGMAISDLNGSFELATVPDGAHDLAAYASGWAPVRLNGVHAPDDPDAEEIVIRVSPGGTLVVRTVGADGQPISGVKVSVRQIRQDPSSLLSLYGHPPPPTDPEGRTVADLLTPGPYEITIPGHENVPALIVEVHEGRQAEAVLTIAEP